MRLALLLALVVALLVPSPAQAGWKIDRAKAIAAKVWHDPCGGEVTVRWAPSSAAPLQQSAMPELTFAPMVMGWALLEECTVVFSTDTVSGWLHFCTAMIHEYGHLAGYRDPLNVADPLHSRRTWSVMNADPPPDYRRCRDRGRWFLTSRR